MPLTSPRYSNQGFFNHSTAPSQADKTEQKPIFLDVEGALDDGFPAIAAGLINNFLMHPKANSALINQILPHHYTYFPTHKSNLPGLVTAVERMQQLMKYVRMDELVQTLAYTLRQIAVMEMCKSPHLYRAAFVDHPEGGITPKEMRRPSVALGECGIAALADALECPIEVLVVDRIKTAPLRLHYHAMSGGPSPIILKLQDRRYEPRVTLKDRFAAIGSLPSRTLQPMTDTSVVDPSLSEIIVAIDAEDELLIERFEDAYRRLAVMVAAGELNKDTLMALYVKGIGIVEASSRSALYVTTEHGTQDFFDAVIRAQRGAQKDHLPIKGHEQQLIDELVHALARAIAVGKMPAALVFAQLDEQIDEELDARMGA